MGAVPLDTFVDHLPIERGHCRSTMVNILKRLGLLTLADILAYETEEVGHYGMDGWHGRLAGERGWGAKSCRIMDAILRPHLVKRSSPPRDRMACIEEKLDRILTILEAK